MRIHYISILKGVYSSSLKLIVALYNQKAQLGVCMCVYTIGSKRYLDFKFSLHVEALLIFEDIILSVQRQFS